MFLLLHFFGMQKFVSDSCCTPKSDEKSAMCHECFWMFPCTFVQHKQNKNLIFTWCTRGPHLNLILDTAVPLRLSVGALLETSEPICPIFVNYETFQIPWTEIVQKLPALADAFVPE